MVAVNIWFWVGFIAFVLGMLALDLGVFNRTPHAVKPKEASVWVAVWVSLALLFAVGLYFYSGHEAAILFLTGYVIEESLSVDNIFVIVLIFQYFRVPAEYQHRVLFWGILGALLMRGLFIGVGALLIAQFHWILYVFGAFLVITAIRMVMKQDEEFDGESNAVVRSVRRIFPVTGTYRGKNFFTMENGRRMATPLFVTLVLVEFTDLMFAVDSIPAIFAVTTDPFIVFTSNIFAILGLRSMYFLLAAVVHKFHLLKYGLAFILAFIGTKMLLVDVIEVPIVASLAIVLGTLTLSVIASLIWPQSALEVAPEEVEGRTGSLFGRLGAAARRRNGGGGAAAGR
jgi:tellurite resistance protein TerC